MSLSRLAIAAPFLAAALIAGCGSASSSSSSSSSSTTAAATGGAAGAVSLTETEFKLTPASPSIAKTGQVTIDVRNSGKITHALAVLTPSGIVRTSDIAPGGSTTLTVNVSKAGSYTFYCPIDHHRQLGMHGVLVVGSSGGAAVATSSSTTSSSSSMPAGY